MSDACFNELQEMPKPTVVPHVTEEITTSPIKRVQNYDDKDFENFIKEWALTLGDSNELFCIGGAGDKGRDVVVKYPDGSLDYYQCKQYNNSIGPSVAILEFGKLLYYTMKGTISIPKNYYLIASRNLTNDLIDLLNDSSKLKTYIINKWDDKCKNGITSKFAIPLDDEIKEYINSFDFGIIKTKAIEQIISEHKNTLFYSFRFGTGLTVKRDFEKEIQEVNNKHIYEKKLFELFSELTGTIINDEETLKDYPDSYAIFKTERSRFYSAINLKEFKASFAVW